VQKTDQLTAEIQNIQSFQFNTTVKNKTDLKRWPICNQTKGSYLCRKICIKL